MDEITLDGKTYISSKRAASITGYAKDYIGQLCREGRVEARLVGRSWYVSEPSLEAHRFEDGRKNEKGKDSIIGSVQQRTGHEMENASQKVDLGYGLVGTEIDKEQSDISSKYNVFSDTSYQSEPVVELPEIMQVDAAVTEPVDRVAEMQTAWQEWFGERAQEALKHPESPRYDPNPREEVKAATEDRYIREEPASIPVRKLVSDIEPSTHPIRQETSQGTSIQSVSSGFVQKTVKSVGAQKRSHRNRQPFFKALIIALILLTVSITLIATGATEILHIGAGGNPVYDYLSGNTSVK